MFQYITLRNSYIHLHGLICLSTCFKKQELISQTVIQLACLLAIAIQPMLCLLIQYNLAINIPQKQGRLCKKTSKLGSL